MDGMIPLAAFLQGQQQRPPQDTIDDRVPIRVVKAFDFVDDFWGAVTDKKQPPRTYDDAIKGTPSGGDRKLTKPEEAVYTTALETIRCFFNGEIIAPEDDDSFDGPEYTTDPDAGIYVVSLPTMPVPFLAIVGTNNLGQKAFSALHGPLLGVISESSGQFFGPIYAHHDMPFRFGDAKID